MIDFSLWDQLLKCYVNDQGQVDYKTWQHESLSCLKQWIHQTQSSQNHDCRIGAIAPHDDQLAVWINLYNALTVAQVLEHYPIQSIQPKIVGVTNWLGFLCFFMKPVYKYGRRSLSLNDIEHSMLRRQFRDPRIHFALVCASTGCPLLRPEAYDPKRVQSQLEDDATRFINNPDKVRYSSRSHTLYCSKIFKWYRKDFLMQSASVQSYIERYWKGSPLPSVQRLRYLPYDWSLNRQ